MKKILISLLVFGYIGSVFALETPEKQIKTMLEEEKQTGREKTDLKTEEEFDYQELTRQTRYETGKARNKGHVSAGYEHIKSKYQANTSLKKYKAEFEERKNLEIRLLKLTPYEPSAKDDTTEDNKSKAEN